MAIHTLGGRASINVMSVKGTFASLVPKVARAETGGRMLQFGNPRGVTSGVDIAFRFKTKDLPKGFSFGIKQFVSVDWYSYSYKGNKPIDGWIWHGFKTPDRFTLDISNAALEVIYHPLTNLPTGAKATAPWAPFYSNEPEIVKDGLEIEQSIGDAPGASFSLELRNAATDRVNYLDSIRMKQTFLTVLTAVKPDRSHVPLEAAYWQNITHGNVIWDGKPDPNVSGVVHTNKGVGIFKDIQSNFLVCDFSLLAKPSLGAQDCIVQKMNDAMYNVRGMYKAQDFTKPTKATTRIEAKGYEIIQYPTAP